MSQRDRERSAETCINDAPSDIESNSRVAAARSQISNEDIIPNPGKVEIGEARLWGLGVVEDIANTAGTWWIQEMSNFNLTTIAVTLLMFITVIAPTLTFGAVYGKVTGNLIGTVETIIATTWVGIVYSLVGGMPLCIVGSTGPVVAFTRALVAIAAAIDVPFLTFNLWVSVWLVFYASMAALFDVTRIIRLATRFTDEIFGFLIISIYVMDSIGNPFSFVGILRYFDKDHPFYATEENTTGFNYMETALLSTILGFGTTALIFFFRSFKFSAFFCCQQIRTNLHDFAAPFAVIIMTLIKVYMFGDIEVEQLHVPDRVEPSFKCCDKSCHTYFPDDCPDQEAAFRVRSWFVSFGDLNGKSWVPMMAAGPAVLAFVLIFLDNGITWHLINQKTHMLRHGEAYNYDLILNGAFNFLNAMLGLPWLVASTVPCLVHLNSLAEKDKEGHILYVQETRLTMLFSHIMLALSLLALQQLQKLPMPVLYGVFLFMGISVLSTNQFWKRVLMFFQQTDKHPISPWKDHIEAWRVHVFTTIQIILFGLVFLVQNIDLISIGFPLMTLLCIPVRLYLLPLYFEGWELLLLDGEDGTIKKWLKKKSKIARKMHLLAMNYCESEG